MLTKITKLLSERLRIDCTIFRTRDRSPDDAEYKEPGRDRHPAR